MTNSFLNLRIVASIVACLAVSVLVSNVAAQSSPHVFNGRQYEIVDRMTMTWEQARDYAIARGGYLACINSAEEQAFVEGLVSKGSREAYWIGGYRDGSWKWVSNETFTYNNWAPGQPGADTRLAMRRTAWSGPTGNDVTLGHWDDAPNSAAYGFVIEYSGSTRPPAPNIFNGREYEVIERGMTWIQARDLAIARGGYLACINSAEEQAFVVSLISKGNRDAYWIGGYRDGTWKWVSNETFNYNKWAPGQPATGDRLSMSLIRPANVTFEAFELGFWVVYALDSDHTYFGLVIEYTRLNP